MSAKSSLRNYIFADETFPPNSLPEGCAVCSKAEKKTQDASTDLDKVDPFSG